MGCPQAKGIQKFFLGAVALICFNYQQRHPPDHLQLEISICGFTSLFFGQGANPRCRHVNGAAVGSRDDQSAACLKSFGSNSWNAASHSQSGDGPARIPGTKASSYEAQAGRLSTSSVTSPLQGEEVCSACALAAYSPPSVLASSFQSPSKPFTTSNT